MIGSSLPICPAGMVSVVLVPSTATPSMNCRAELFDDWFRQRHRHTRRLSCSCAVKIHRRARSRRRCQGGERGRAISNWLDVDSVAAVQPTVRRPCRQRHLVPQHQMRRRHLVSHPVLQVEHDHRSRSSDRRSARGAGRRAGRPLTSGPNIASPCSRRVRPLPSRAIWALFSRTMRLPSASVCTISVTASAEYGAPATGSLSNAIGPDMNSMFIGLKAMMLAPPCARTPSAQDRSNDARTNDLPNHLSLHGINRSAGVSDANGACHSVLSKKHVGFNNFARLLERRAQRAERRARHLHADDLERSGQLVLGQRHERNEFDRQLLPMVALQPARPHGSESPVCAAPDA